jgi:hypothetical protein
MTSGKRHPVRFVPGIPILLRFQISLENRFDHQHDGHLDHSVPDGCTDLATTMSISAKKLTNNSFSFAESLLSLKMQDN